MQKGFLKKLLISFAACLVIGVTWFTPSALAVNNPELLPDYVTPVVDLANYLPSLQEKDLVTELEDFEAETGWKMRVLTQYDQTPGRAVIKYWGLDDKTILLVADGKGGNILAFSIGDDVYEVIFNVGC